MGCKVTPPRGHPGNTNNSICGCYVSQPKVTEMGFIALKKKKIKKIGQRRGRIDPRKEKKKLIVNIIDTQWDKQL